MIDVLNDDELYRAACEYARLSELNKRAYVLPEALELARLASAAAAEVLDLRARLAIAGVGTDRPRK